MHLCSVAIFHTIFSNIFRSEEECEAWLNALQNAIKQNNCRQMTFLNMNFVPMNAAEGPLKLGREVFDYSVLY